MDILPYVTSADEAIAYYRSATSCTDAAKAYLIAFLSNAGFSNRAIRTELGIEKVYTVTHFKRAGLLLSEEELALWHKNSRRITLGHVRAIAKLPQRQREQMLRTLLIKKTPVHQFEAIAKGNDSQHDVDVKRYQERMAEVLGRPVSIRYNGATQTGSLTLDFFNLEDLDHLTAALGYLPSDEF